MIDHNTMMGMQILDELGRDKDMLSIPVTSSLRKGRWGILRMKYLYFPRNIFSEMVTASQLEEDERMWGENYFDWSYEDQVRFWRPAKVHIDDVRVREEDYLGSYERQSHRMDIALFITMGYSTLVSFFPIFGILPIACLFLFIVMRYVCY
ncbi:MAG: hypothetical protein Ta2D_12680 [Rickettsiales bacterium]|nr:MAG: hypothetical protein Ta2D_12680 [Rickettsiales bacterium]